MAGLTMRIASRTFNAPIAVISAVVIGCWKETPTKLWAAVVDFLDLGLRKQAHAPAEVRQIVFNQLQVRVPANPELLDPPEIDRARPPKSAEDLVPLGQKQLGEVRAILPRDARDQCGFHRARIRQFRFRGRG